jgi:AcrR family transcriptional regulator
MVSDRMQHVTIVDDSAEAAETSPDALREGLRERKKAKTRRALEDAALDLFHRQGFDHTTVEQIADACDVSPRTFFRYFATKEDVLFGDSGEKHAAFQAALEARPVDEPPLRSLRAAALELCGTMGGDRERRKARAEIIAATPVLRARGSERQDDWNDAATQFLLHRGAPGSPLTIRLVVAASNAAMRAAVHTWLEDEATELNTLIDDAFDQLGAGLDA